MAPLASGLSARDVGARCEEFSGPCLGEEAVAVVDEAIVSVAIAKPTT
jgi:hypothetical protein